MEVKTDKDKYFRVDSQTHNEFKIFCKDRGISIKKALKKACQEYINNNFIS